MTNWRLAHGLEKLRSQVNARWSNRSKESDGAKGDDRHAALPSDHNPVDGVVHAIDLTHDPLHGFDSYAFADMLLKNRDTRIKYVISNRRIGSGDAGPQPWVWRKYTGANPHDHHVHISIKSDAAHFDSTVEWKIDGGPIIADPNFVPPPPLVTIGQIGSSVEKLQTKLGVKVTGSYEANSETEFALKLFQVRHQLTPDGRAGPQVWKALA
jgi:peptidoglycan hydrolase-like protein with peptidoglycan-binding domain